MILRLTASKYLHPEKGLLSFYYGISPKKHVVKALWGFYTTERVSKDSKLVKYNFLDGILMEVETYETEVFNMILSNDTHGGRV